MTNKKTLFTLIFIALILIVFIVFEILLKVVNFGLDTRVFHKVKNSPFLVLNPGYINKYYPSMKNPKAGFKNEFGKILFKENKLSNEVRIFVLGGSSVEGFPFAPNQNFTKILENSLNFTDTNGVYFNVINLGFAAMSSYYVRDVALKILKYKPDMIVIYSGHNEYYGTMSASTGRSYFLNNLNLKLKEIKIFQVFFTLFQKKIGSPADQDLMSRQFNDHYFLPDDVQDRKVADAFIRNIDKICKTYKKKKIPVVLLNPICNTKDMPPFAGQQDESYSHQINEGLTNVNNMSKDISNSLEQNANLRYLYAKKTQKYNDFIAAKNLDIVPFRVRSVLNNKIDEYLNKHEDQESLYTVHLSASFNKISPDDWYGNKYFIDHLHFNMKGHQQIAYMLSKKILKITLNQGYNQKRLNSYFSNTNIIYSQLGYEGMNTLFPFYVIEILSKNPPYLDMKIKYQPQIVEKPNMQLENLIENSKNSKMLNDQMYYMILQESWRAKDWDSVNKMLINRIKVFPALSESYLSLARFYFMQQKEFEKVQVLFIMSYLLSNKEDSIYDEYSNMLSAYSKPFADSRDLIWRGEFDSILSSILNN